MKRRIVSKESSKKNKYLKKKLVELEKKVLESSVLTFSFLKDDIKIFNEENFNQAHQKL